MTDSESVPLPLPKPFPTPALDCKAKGGLFTCLGPLGPIGAATCADLVVNEFPTNLLAAHAGLSDGVDEKVEAVLSTPELVQTVCEGCYAEQATMFLGHPHKVCKSRFCYVQAFGCASNFIAETCKGFQSLPGVTAPREPVLDESVDVAELFLKDLTGEARSIIPADVVDDEGLTYYILYRLLSNLLLAPCIAPDELLPGLPLPGWEELQVINLTQTSELESGGLRDTPFIHVLRRNDKKELLILARGFITLTELRLATFEEQIDFVELLKEIDEETTAPGVDDSDRPGIRQTHAAIFEAVYPLVKDLVEKNKRDVERIILSGFSLGGPVAAFIAVALAVAYPDKRVDVVAFGPLRAFDAAFSVFLQSFVNPRYLAYEFDAVPETGCAIKGPACQADHPIAKGELNVYVDWPRRVIIMDEELGEPEDIGPLQIWPAHICSYLCWAVRNFAPDDEVNWCQRAPKDGKPLGKGLSWGDVCPFSVENLPIP
ncbi:unnamed protein product [Vitrella brassicaformis CCMP3155]|uniref:Fungal lipase-type domain-containing protein n=1 Tax=Vitrella brassicaformis (strain CCMP3155) TaxID=1169540 RepID=A0A0G4ELU6_VITBC|nr:unnamed protein product [Vitrella brassicaformis CCMP3155]|eukprot:CEL97808.1 unnamed protein product [Vitrella brassicaformis CCMP3155]